MHTDEMRLQLEAHPSQQEQPPPTRRPRSLQRRKEYSVITNRSVHLTKDAVYALVESGGRETAYDCIGKSDMSEEQKRKLRQEADWRFHVGRHQSD